MIFHDYTLRADGTIQSHREHNTRDLATPAVRMFSEMLAAGPQFRRPIPVPAFGHIDLHWTAAGGNAMASFAASGALVTTSILLSGRSPAQEPELLAALDSILASLGQSPAGLVIAARPVLITIPLPVVSPDVGLIADMETCLAAAYFGGLANLPITP